jgi:hypothetical protein
MLLSLQVKTKKAKKEETSDSDSIPSDFPSKDDDTSEDNNSNKNKLPVDKDLSSHEVYEWKKLNQAHNYWQYVPPTV